MRESASLFSSSLKCHHLYVLIAAMGLGKNAFMLNSECHTSTMREIANAGVDASVLTRWLSTRSLSIDWDNFRLRVRSLGYWKDCKER